MCLFAGRNRIIMSTKLRHLTGHSISDGYEKQEALCRRCDPGSSCTPRARLANILVLTAADAGTLRGAVALSYTAKGDRYLRLGDCRKPSRCGLRLSWRLVVRAARIFDGRSFGETPAGRPAHDTGFGRDIDKQFRTMPLVFRAITFYSLWQPAADQLRAAGYDQKWLRAILLTHSHWDHVSGLPDFPGVPVWVTAGTRVHQEKRRHGLLQTLYRHTV